MTKKKTTTEQELWWPRPYISWSQYNLWKTSQRQYLAHYCPSHCRFCGTRLWRPDWTSGHCRECFNVVISEWTNPAMELGLRVAEMLEHNGVKQHDKMLEYYRQTLPKYPFHEFQILKSFLGIKFSGKLDGFDPKKLIIGEYKTGRDWSQERADHHRQLDWYQLLVWLQYRRMAKKIYLHWIPTRFNIETMLPELTGEVKTFESPRTKAQILKMAADAQVVHKEIGIACGALPDPYVVHRVFPMS